MIDTGRSTTEKRGISSRADGDLSDEALSTLVNEESADESNIIVDESDDAPTGGADSGFSTIDDNELVELNEEDSTRKRGISSLGDE